MSTIPELEAKWRDAAAVQAEAKRELDATLNQLGPFESTLEAVQEPAVAIAYANLAKSGRDYQAALEALLKAANELQPDSPTDG